MGTGYPTISQLIKTVAPAENVKILPPSYFEPDNLGGTFPVGSAKGEITSDTYLKRGTGYPTTGHVREIVFPTAETTSEIFKSIDFGAMLLVGSGKERKGGT